MILTISFSETQSNLKIISLETEGPATWDQRFKKAEVLQSTKPIDNHKPPHSKAPLRTVMFSFSLKTKYHSSALLSSLIRLRTTTPRSILIT
jgi:hypothetical protein